MLIYLHSPCLILLGEIIPGEKEIKNATDDIWLRPAGWIITVISIIACLIAGYFVVQLIHQRKEDRLALDKASADKVQLASSSSTMIERCVNELREFRGDLKEAVSKFEDGVKNIDDKIETLWRFLIGKGGD